MKRNTLCSALVMLVIFASVTRIYASDPSTEKKNNTKVTEKDLEIEKMKLEVERQKLENQRLQLQIDRDQLGKDQKQLKPEKSIKASAGQKESIAAEKAGKSAKLAKLNAKKSDLLVIDFTNGELWYMGVRSSINDLQELFSREKWPEKRKTVKRNANGYAREKLAHLNIYGLKYEHRSRGVFVWDLANGEGCFKFATPEGITSGSAYADIRNAFENEIYTFSRQNKDGKYRILQFKNKKGTLSFDDMINFWFDENDKLTKVEWGVLDEN